MADEANFECVSFGNVHACSSCFDVFSSKYNAHRHYKRIHKKLENTGENLEELQTTKYYKQTNNEEDCQAQDAMYCESQLNGKEGETDMISLNSENVSDNFLDDIWDQGGSTDLLDVFVENGEGLADLTFESDAKVDNIDYLSDNSDEDHGYDDPADLSDDWLFEKSPIHSALTIKNHAAAVMGFAIRHNCSEKEMNDLLALIKLHLPEENRCIETYRKVKIVLGEMNTAKHVEYCEKCCKIWPEDREVFKCSTDGCDGLRYQGAINDQMEKIKPCFFVKADMKAQLKDILEREGLWDQVLQQLEKRNKESGTLEDILDGSEYRKHCGSPNSVLHQNNNLTAIFNTDGAAIYKSSRTEIWPIYVAINEIPPKLRTEYVIGNLEDIVEKCFLVDGNADCVCIARVPNVVESD